MEERTSRFPGSDKVESVLANVTAGDAINRA